MLLRQTLTFRYDKMVPIDLQLSSKPEDTTGVIMEIVKVQDEESIVDELYAIYEDDLLIDEWICTFFVKRLQDGLYLSVDPNRKHVYWSENKGLKQVFRMNEDGPLFSYLGTYIARLGRSPTLWQVDEDSTEYFTLRFVENSAYSGKFDYLKDLVVLTNEY